MSMAAKPTPTPAPPPPDKVQALPQSVFIPQGWGGKAGKDDDK